MRDLAAGIQKRRRIFRRENESIEWGGVCDFDLRQPPIHERDLANQDDFLERAIWFSERACTWARTWPRPRIRDVLQQRFQNTLWQWDRVGVASDRILILVYFVQLVRIKAFKNCFVMRLGLGILRFSTSEVTFDFHAWHFFLLLFRASAFTHCLLIENQEEFLV